LKNNRKLKRRTNAEDANEKKQKLSGTHFFHPLFFHFAFFLDKLLSNIMDPPMNLHISINTLAKIKAYNNFINDEDQPGEEERKNFKEFQ
jgi:hypothetical protein